MQNRQHNPVKVLSKDWAFFFFFTVATLGFIFAFQRVPRPIMRNGAAREGEGKNSKWEKWEK